MEPPHFSGMSNPILSGVKWQFTHKKKKSLHGKVNTDSSILSSVCTLAPEYQKSDDTHVTIPFFQ